MAQIDVYNSEMKFLNPQILPFGLAKAKTQLSAKGPGLVVVITTEKRAATAAFAGGLSDALRERAKVLVNRKKDKPKAGEVLVSEASNPQEATLVVGLTPKDDSAFSLLGFGKKLLKPHLQEAFESLSIVFEDVKDEALFADCLGSAFAARIFKMPTIGKRTEKEKDFKIKIAQIFSSKNVAKNFQEGVIKGNGTNRVRYLGMLPNNILNTLEYGKRIKKICSEYGFALKFYSNTELKKMGAGSFTAVDQGDPDSHGGIYEITYSPRAAKNKKTVALVGKGLCFDTGGYDIKTGGYMLTMKGDMQGSAVALSTLVACAELKLPLKMKAYLGVTENHISPKAYTADNVVVALNGTSIEVINTDAEGRMVLADVLCIADKGDPDLIMDFATLTGSAVRSIGTAYSAVFTSMDKWHSKIVDAGVNAGERVWTFPMPSDYEKRLESPIADTIQCSKSPGIDHILAAIFLKKFISEDRAWVHVDLAAAENDGGLAHTDTMFTGFGVRFAVEFLRTNYKV